MGSYECLLLLCIVSSCLGIVQASPHRLPRCPDELNTLVLPMPETEGDPVLLMAGPGVQLRTVEFLRDRALRVEANRLLLNKSMIDAAGSQSPYNGPHVLLCSEERVGSLTSSFILFIKLPLLSAEPQLADSPAPATAEFSDPSPFLFLLTIVALVACFATCLAVCLALALTKVLLRLRRRSSYRDFRHFCASYRTDRKLVV